MSRRHHPWYACLSPTQTGAPLKSDTVGPIVGGWLTGKDKELLSSCYRSCLKLAEKNGIHSIAFCCISTGEFHFPNDKAAQIAVDTVKEYKEQTNSEIEVIFNVFKNVDLQIYRRLLG